jgi:hypothetical protein
MPSRTAEIGKAQYGRQVRPATPVWVSERSPNRYRGLAVESDVTRIGGTEGMSRRLVMVLALAALPGVVHAQSGGFVQAPPCLHYGPKSSNLCNNDGLLMEAVNSCDRPLIVEICLGRRNGTVNCGNSGEAIRPGRSWSFYTCSPNNRYSVKARLPAGAAQTRRPAACPDHYFRSADPADHGRCIKCDAIWSNGHCIYD